MFVKTRLITLTFIFVLLFFSVAMAEETGSKPTLAIYTDRCVYGAGESGTISLELNTYGLMRDAEIEVVVLSPENIIVDGVIIYTDIPEKVVINKDTMQTEQTIIKEGVLFLGDERTVFRTISFTIPEAAPTGDYRIIAKARYIGGVLEQENVISVIGQGVVDSILVIYILILFVVLLAIIHYKTKDTKKRRRKR